MINCAVVGATGYTGIEIVRILMKHPKVKVTSVTTRKEDLQDIRNLMPELSKSSDLKLEEYDFKEVSDVCDVVFLALPHTVSIDKAKGFLKKGKIVIDLSADFRLKDYKVYEKWYNHKHAQKDLLAEAVYGLPEIYRNKIKKADLIANPGCYPTSIILAIKPLLEEGLVETGSITVDSKTGLSGAGRKLIPAFQFSEVEGNFKAYKVNKHQHSPEIESILSDVAGTDVKIDFVPHLLPLMRGILSTVYLKKKDGVKKKDVFNAFQKAYQKEPFVRVKNEGVFPALHDVRYTNFCDIGIWADNDSPSVIVISAIDNLIKGASGQAVQNMNIRCNFSEELGLI